MIAHLPVSATPSPSPDPGSGSPINVDLFWLALVPMLAGLLLILAAALGLYLAGRAKATLAEAVLAEARTKLADAEARKLAQENIKAGNADAVIQTADDGATATAPEISKDAISALERAFSREPQLVVGLLLLIAPLVVLTGYGIAPS